MLFESTKTIRVATFMDYGKVYFCSKRFLVECRQSGVASETDNCVEKAII